jgi:hypothetical protein
MEYDRQSFQQPSSVVSVAVHPGSNPPKLAIPGTESITELFKKGFEPTEYDTTGYKLPAPSGFTVKESANNKAVLSWQPVDPGVLANSSHGKFGYNIYKDGTLIDWTDKTSYTYTASSIYGTYKVIATYKNFADVQSYEASYTLEKQEEPEEPTCPSDAIVSGNTCKCKDSNKEYDDEEKKCKPKE